MYRNALDALRDGLRTAMDSDQPQMIDWSKSKNCWLVRPTSVSSELHSRPEFMVMATPLRFVPMTGIGEEVLRSAIDRLCRELGVT